MAAELSVDLTTTTVGILSLVTFVVAYGF